MAQRNEGFHYPTQVDSESENGRQLLEIQRDERQKKRDEDGMHDKNGQGRSRNVYPGELDCTLVAALPSGQLFTGKGRVSNDHLRLDRHDAPSDDNVYFKRESTYREKALYVGVRSGTTMESYSRGVKIVVTRYDICFQETHKPKSIDERNTAVVYEPAKQNYGPLQPTVLRFTSGNDT